MVSLRCGEVFDSVSVMVVMALVMKRESRQTFFLCDICVCVCFYYSSCKTFYTLFPNVIYD